MSIRRISSLLLVALIVLSGAGYAPAADELKITQVRLAHGPVGPDRKSNQMLAGDEMFVRYLVEGVKTDEQGKIQIENRLSILNPEGKEIFQQAQVANDLLALGGDVYPGISTMTTGPGVPAGEYLVRVTARDLIAKVDATAEQKVVVVEPRFGIVRLRFFDDPDGKADATTRGVVGDRVFFRLSALNFAREGGVHVLMQTQLFDAQGEKPVMVKPLAATVKVDNPQEIEKARVVGFNGFVSFSRAGDFTLRITLTDEKGMKEERIDLPLKVE